MIADIEITEKSFGAKLLMSNVKFSVDDGEKVGVIGRNGVGKSTMFGILAGTDTDFTGNIIYRRGTTVVATANAERFGPAEVVSDVDALVGVVAYAAPNEIDDEDVPVWDARTPNDHP